MVSKHTAKLYRLAEIEGYADPLDFLEEFVIESVVPGICMNDDCDYTTDVEPDSEDGWCECCESNSVSSGVELGLLWVPFG